MMSNIKYGYTVRYKRQGSNKWKVYLVTNTYDLAVWHVRWYQREPPEDSETKLPILNAKWLIIPVKTYHEYRRLWRDCPFDP